MSPVLASNLQNRLAALAQAVGADIKSINSKLGNATVLMDPWHNVGAATEPIFLNSWTNYGGIYERLGFRKDPFGKVMLRGLATNANTINTAAGIFTLPAGYAPPSELMFMCPNTGGGITRVDVTSAGVVTVWPIAAGATIDFSTVEFDTGSVTQVLAGPPGPAGPQGIPGSSVQVPMDTWHVVGSGGGEPVFQNGWSSTSAGSVLNALRFRKNPLGRVTLAGQVLGGASGSVVFTLPPGYRPPVNNAGSIIIPVVSGSGASGATGGYAQIFPATGNVAITNFGGAGSSCYLENVEFDTETVTQFAVGPKGDKGDSGGVLPVVTLDWNTATGQGFYKSTNAFGQTTVNGPGDTLNPPPQSGYVQVHDNGTILQRVWDVSAQKTGYARYRIAGVWTLWVPDLAKPPVFTDIMAGLPAPADGDERYFQSPELAALGVMWKFRYNKNSTSPYKWEFVGGSEWGQLIATNEAFTAVGAWCNLATNGPLYTVPLAGDYVAEGSAMLTTAFTTAWHAAYLGFAVGDNNAFDYGGGLIIDTNALQGMVTPHLKVRALGLTAGTMLKMRYYSTSGGNVLAQLRKLYVRPIRVSM